MGAFLVIVVGLLGIAASPGCRPSPNPGPPVDPRRGECEVGPGGEVHTPPAADLEGALVRARSGRQTRQLQRRRGRLLRRRRPPHKATAWIVPFMTRAWRYTKATYGDFGGPRRPPLRDLPSGALQRRAPCDLLRRLARPPECHRLRAGPWDDPSLGIPTRSATSSRVPATASTGRRPSGCGRTASGSSSISMTSTSASASSRRPAASSTGSPPSPTTSRGRAPTGSATSSIRPGAIMAARG